MSSAPAPNIMVGIIDHLDPEVRAMMMAMYSRSYGPIVTRMPQNEQEQASLKTRLEKYYVGYGHKSVGQLGETCIFFEGVSQLAAKAIEDHQLFNGQESSTRYIDFSNQPMYDFGDENISSWQEKWRALYIKAVPMVTERLKLEYPIQEGQKQETWENTIKARAFDICRSLLPDGCVTNVAFSGTFDTINNHFGQMLYHPSVEMHDIAVRALTQLKEKYSHATPGVEELGKQFQYVTPYHFYALDEPQDCYEPILRIEGDLFNKNISNLLRTIAHMRQKGQALPKQLAAHVRFWLRGFLDFGSFRDLHRHRNGTCIMPLHTPIYGFDRWYVDNLPPFIALEALSYLTEQRQEWTLFVTHQERVQYQYALPMGAQVAVRYNCDLNQMIYLIELRTGKTVHQTLRRYMQEVYSTFRDFTTIPVAADMADDNFTLKRGTQTFSSGEFK